MAVFFAYLFNVSYNNIYEKHQYKDLCLNDLTCLFALGKKNLNFKILLHQPLNSEVTWQKKTVQMLQSLKIHTTKDALYKLFCRRNSSVFRITIRTTL